MGWWGSRMKEPTPITPSLLPFIIFPSLTRRETRSELVISFPHPHSSYKVVSFALFSLERPGMKKCVLFMHIRLSAAKSKLLYSAAFRSDT